MGGRTTVFITDPRKLRLENTNWPTSLSRAGKAKTTSLAPFLYLFFPSPEDSWFSEAFGIPLLAYPNPAVRTMGDAPTRGGSALGGPSPAHHLFPQIWGPGQCLSDFSLGRVRPCVCANVIGLCKSFVIDEKCHKLFSASLRGIVCFHAPWIRPALWFALTKRT